MRRSRHDTVVVSARRSLIQAWQDRFRDLALTILLPFEKCAIFLAVPLAANGFPIGEQDLPQPKGWHKLV
jgi:hypothetical protein